MDGNQFDVLARQLNSRRTVLGGLLVGLLLPLEAGARGKGNSRQRKRKGKGKNRSKGQGQDKQHKHASAQAEVCWRAGACIPKKGANVSRCDLAGYTPTTTLDCTGCNMSRANLRGANLSSANLTRANLSGACLVDATLSGATVANNTNLANAIFCNTTMPDGSINNSGCQRGTDCCWTGCRSSTDCEAGQLCEDGACQACDVCASGCTHTSIQAAIDAASAGSIVRICPGTYTPPNREVLEIGKNLTLVGAGTGATGTIIQGNDIDRVIALVQVKGSVVAIQGLTITGGQGVSGGGIIVFNTMTLSLTDVLVTKNRGRYGGGISNGGALTLNAGTSVTGNTASDGGGIYNLASVTLNPGSSVSGNSPNDCHNTSTGTGCP